MIKTKLNIAIVVGIFPALSETFILNQIIALLNRGHRIHILAFNKGDAKILHQSIIEHKLLDKVSFYNVIPNSKFKRIQFLFKWIIKNNFSVKWGLFFRTINFFKFGKQALTLKLFFENLWFLSKDRFDIIHVHFGHNAKLITDLKEKGFLKGSKLVVSFHGYDIIPNKVEVYKEQYKKLFKYTDVITVNTIYTKNILLKVNASLSNISILPVGLDTKYFSKTNKIKNEMFTILYCGRLVPFKGADLTISIFGELIIKGHKNIKLEIIGEGVLENKLKEKIQILELEKHVTLHGALNQDKVKKVMEISNVFLLPGITESETYRSENQGLVIQEAQAMELPVIVSDAGGMQYGLLPNESGFVIKEKEISDFADAIEQLLDNNSLCESMGKRGRGFVVKNYDNEVLISKLLQLYSL